MTPRVDVKPGLLRWARERARLDPAARVRRFPMSQGRTCAAPWSMARSERILKNVLAGGSDANVRFDDLRNLLFASGFEQRTRGSHHLFSRSGVAERINLQRDGKHAKAYQVRQVRRILLRYGLAGED